jgi:hypothetical protein
MLVAPEVSFSDGDGFVIESSISHLSRQSRRY